MDYPKVNDVWEYIKLENNSTDHIDLTPSSVHNDYKGSFLVSTNGIKSTFQKILKPNVNDIQIIAMGGIDFDTLEHFGALRKNLYNFNSCLLSETNFNVHYYFPLYTKEKRYNELLQFHSKSNYYSEEMMNMALKYVIPRIFSGKNVYFFCFSASCRELIMIENATRDFLEKMGMSTEIIKIAMSHVHAVQVGYAFDWSNQNCDSSFKKLCLLSVEDFGILRSKFNREFIYGISTLKDGVNVISKDENNNNMAIIFGSNVVPIQIDNKINWKGHSLPHYIHAFNEMIKDSNYFHSEIDLINKIQIIYI